MLERFGASEEHIRWAEEEPEEEVNEVEMQVCFSCGRSKEKHRFSKTQLRKYGTRLGARIVFIRLVCYSNKLEPVSFCVVDYWGCLCLLS